MLPCAQAYWLEFLSLIPPFAKQATKSQRHCPQRSNLLSIERCMIGIRFANLKG